MRKILRIATGVGFILIGIVGLIMPIMPGWIFIIPGLMILSEYSKTCARLLAWVKARFQDARQAYNRKAPPTPSATMEDRPGPGQ